MVGRMGVGVVNTLLLSPRRDHSQPMRTAFTGFVYARLRRVGVRQVLCDKLGFLQEANHVNLVVWYANVQVVRTVNYRFPKLTASRVGLLLGLSSPLSSKLRTFNFSFFYVF